MSIISHSRRFIFVAVPKTGSFRVREALRAELGPEDEEQMKLRPSPRRPDAGLVRVGPGHAPAWVLRREVGAETWREYLTFAVVRNPWERFVAYCALTAGRNGRFEHEPAVCMTEVLDNARNRNRVLIRPQHEFVTDERGAVIVDRLCRAERLQEDFDELRGELSLRAQVLSPAKSLVERDYRSYYDDELVARVRSLYRKDVELFEYDYSS